MAVFLTEMDIEGRRPTTLATPRQTPRLSVFEPGKPNDILAVVKISNPKVEGPDLVYNYKLIEGTLPAMGGATSLFIDWIGRDGGAGLGYRGVGLGYRGPGWTLT